MERISYAGNTVLTGTEIARALLLYAEALAMNNASATVEIPTRTDDGSPGRASVLIGPASQLITETVDEDDEILDPDLVERLTTQTRALGIARPVPADSDDEGGFDVGDLDILSYEHPDITN